MLQFLIVLVLLAIIASLFSGFFFLMKDDGSRRRVVNSLIVRVGLSILLAVLIAVAYFTGELNMQGPF